MNSDSHMKTKKLTINFLNSNIICKTLPFILSQLFVSCSKLLTVSIKLAGIHVDYNIPSMYLNSRCIFVIEDEGNLLQTTFTVFSSKVSSCVHYTSCH